MANDELKGKDSNESVFGNPQNEATVPLSEYQRVQHVLIEMNQQRSIMNIMLYSVGGLLLFVAVLALGSVYLGWRMGRVSVEERIIVPAPNVSVIAPTEIKMPPMVVDVKQPPVNITVPPAPVPEIHIQKDDETQKQLKDVQSQLLRAGDDRTLKLRGVTEQLIEMRRDMSSMKTALSSVPGSMGQRTLIDPDERDIDGRLLPPPKKQGTGER